MRMRAAFCGLLLSVAANANAESLDWLKVVAFAAHQTDYSGVFVYQYDNRIETSRIIHVVEADGEHEKLESLDGPKRKIIRHHGQVWCYINHKMVQVDSQQVRIRFPAFLPEQISTLSANYRAEQIGVARVAGYNAQVILFEPKDNLRYAHKIWADTGSGLLLKAAVLGDKNQIIEQYTFTQLQIGGNIDRSWIGATAPGDSLPASQEVIKGGTPINSGWTVDALPQGFKKTMEIQRPMRGRRTPVTQIVFSDGLSAISVFIEPDDGDEDNVSGLSSRGAINLYHKVVAGQLFTVVGEVPARTVIQVLDSIRYKDK
ncbi:MAG: MucB/RseB C-terminal domain-containing protein [Gallionella sp.]|nr:MucB/RseB C-terminal domain-containing protein [Gallionella sp.]